MIAKKEYNKNGVEPTFNSQRTVVIQRPSANGDQDVDECWYPNPLPKQAHNAKRYKLGTKLGECKPKAFKIEV